MVAGCNKNKDAPAPKPPCRLIASIAGGGTITKFTYNTSGRIETIDDGQYYSVFSYSGNTVTHTRTLNGNFSKRSTITLNSNDMVTNERVAFSSNGLNWYNYAHEYSGTQLIKTTRTNSSTQTIETTTYTWVNGNLVEESNGRRFEYYPDKKNATGDFMQLQHLIERGSGDMLVRNTHLVKVWEEGSDLFNISYDFDNDGKIVGCKLTRGGITFSYTYAYQCE